VTARNCFAIALKYFPYGFKGEVMRLNVGYVRTCAVAIACAALAAAAVASDAPLRVKDGEVSVICPLTVGGSFEATTNAVDGEVAIAGQSAPLKGELTVDLQKLETGIGLRDRHMKNNYLEVDKGEQFAEARLQDIRLDKLEGKITFTGMLTLHGQQKEVTGSADLKPNGSGYRVDATFKVLLSDFQIPDPTYLGVGVKDELQVRVRFNAAPALTAARR
jgi:polyisoprenoid-binding protein YceI